MNNPTSKWSQELAWWRPGLFQVAIGLVALLFGHQFDSDAWWIPGGFLVISGVALLPSCYRALMRPAMEIMADHLFILTIAFLVYFIAGAILLSIGPNDEVDFAQNYYQISSAMALRVAAYNSIGFGLALVASAYAPERLFLRLSSSALRFGSHMKIGWVISGFFMLGAFAYFQVLRFDADPQPGEVIAGTWRSLANLLLVAVVLAAAHQGKGARFLRMMAIGMAIVQTVVGFLMLNKAQTLLPLVALSIGYGWRLGFRKIALPSSIGVISVFLLIAGPIQANRDLNGASSYIDWDTRVAGLTSEAFKPSTNNIEKDYYPWARLCYTPSQAAGLDFYDSDLGGYDFGNIGWAFLPRFLFPGKPVLTTAGQDVHYKITGGTGSSTGMGVFIDGYYNGGTAGVVFNGVIVGLMLGCTSILANLIFKRKALLWFPLALSGDYMAYRIDGFLLGDYIGPFSLLLYALIGAAALLTVLNRSNK